MKMALGKEKHALKQKAYIQHALHLNLSCRLYLPRTHSRMWNQATKMEVVKAYSEIGLRKSTVETKRAQIEDAHKNWYKKAVELAKKVGTDLLCPGLLPDKPCEQMLWQQHQRNIIG